MNKNINLNAEGHCIPFEEVAKAINFMRYGSIMRIMFEMLHFTGCRISELDNMQINLFMEDHIYWHIGKNQKGFRKIKLPNEFIEEIKYYRNNFKSPKIKLFGTSANTFRRRFNSEIRPNLGDNWNKLRVVETNSELTTEFEYQLKGMRKNYQTFNFNKNYQKWKDASIAIEFTSKEMKHSSKNITAYHYVENNDKLNVKNYLDCDYNKIINKKIGQTNLIDFLETIEV